MMEIKLQKKTIFIFLGIILLLASLYPIYILTKPVKTIFFRGIPFSFREDVKRALEVEIFPKEEMLHDLFQNYKIKNVTILFKPGSPETNALYQVQTFEIVYKLSNDSDC